MPTPSSVPLQVLLLSLSLAAAAAAAASFDGNVPSSQQRRVIFDGPIGGSGMRGPRRRMSAAAEKFLAAHNRVRGQVGEKPMRWDRALTKYARSWARKRVWDCKMTHSYGQYGENLFWGGGGEDQWSPEEIVESWASERKYYNAQTNGCADGHLCGHYTQVVWNDSRRLGCARVACANDAGVFGICSYDPPGNFVDESPFHRPASGSPGRQTKPLPFPASS